MLGALNSTMLKKAVLKVWGVGRGTGMTRGDATPAYDLSNDWGKSGFPGEVEATSQIVGEH